MEAVAKLKKCPMSARKMRLVVDIIRGKEVNEAIDILRFTKKEAAVWLEKLLLSAIANWENKAGFGQDADEHDLYIKTVFSDQRAIVSEADLTSLLSCSAQDPNKMTKWLIENRFVVEV